MDVANARIEQRRSAGLLSSMMPSDVSLRACLTRARALAFGGPADPMTTLTSQEQLPADSRRFRPDATADLTR